jgi:colicin import membrane protein
MARAGITEYQVHKAADVLFARMDKQPTNQDVLTYLGHGSMTTINKHMQTWRERKTPSLRATGVRARAVDIIAELYDNLKHQIEEEFDAKITELTERAGDLAEERDTLQTHLNECKDQLDKADAQNAAFQQEIQELNAQIGELASNVKKYQRQSEELFATSEQRMNDLLEQKSMNAALSARHAEERHQWATEIAAAQEQAAALRAAESELRRSLDRALEDLGKATSLARDTKMELGEERKAKQAIEQQLANCRSQVAADNDQIHKLQLQLAKAESEIETEKARNQHLSKETASLERAIEAAGKVEASLTKQLAEAAESHAIEVKKLNAKLERRSRSSQKPSPPPG